MRAMRGSWVLIVLMTGLVIGLVISSDTVYSDRYEREWEDHDHSYDRARRAVGRGEILPMAQVLERLQAQVRGEVVDVELEREHGRWVYEFKIIDTKGRLLEVYVDAQTGAVRSVEDD